MVNQAIEIQAASFKNQILKDVKIDTNEIIEQVKEEQNFARKGRQKKIASETPEINVSGA